MSPKARAGSCPAGWLTWATTTQNPTTQEIDTLQLGIGNYLTPNTTLVVNYGNASVNNGGDTDAYSLDLEHMWLMDKWRLQGQSQLRSDNRPERDDIDTYQVGGYLVLYQNIGIGADYLNTGAPTVMRVQGWQVNSEWFITESFAVNLAYSQLDPDDVEFTRRQA